MEQSAQELDSYGICMGFCGLAGCVGCHDSSLCSGRNEQLPRSVPYISHTSSLHHALSCSREVRFVGLFLSRPKVVNAEAAFWGNHPAHKARNQVSRAKSTPSVIKATRAHASPSSAPSASHRATGILCTLLCCRGSALQGALAYTKTDSVHPAPDPGHIYHRAYPPGHPVPRRVTVLDVPQIRGQVREAQRALSVLKFG
jgi:hypothetical protein